MIISSEELYCKLEAEYRISSDSNIYINYFEARNDRDLVCFKNEQILLSSYKNQFDFILSEENKTRLAEYCLQRLQTAKNIHLLCAYSFSRFYLAKDKNCLFEAISYSETIMQEFSLVGDEDNGVEFGCLFEFLYPLCKQYNKEQSLVGMVNKAIINTELYFHFYILTVLAKFIEAYRTGKESGINIKKDFNQEVLTELCLKDYESDTNFTRREVLLDLALSFSLSIANRDLRKKVCEIKGDYFISHLESYDDENIAIPHINSSKLLSAIKLYKESENEEKLKNATLQYETNKRKLRYITFPLSISRENYEKRRVAIQKIIASISKEGHFQIFLALCGWKLDWFCLNADHLYKIMTNHIKEFSSTGFSSAAKVDSYSNIRQCSHEEIILNHLFDLQYRQYAFSIFTQVLTITMKNNIFSFDTLKEDLCRIGFNCFIVHKEHNGECIQTTPFDMVENGIKEFLNQHQRFVNGEKTDWRFCISFLSTQFEGIMRIIVNSLGVPIVKVKDDNTEFITLESLLKVKELESIFSKEDFLLFNQIYTKAGYNIRNDVAHGLLLPQEYTAPKALLIFTSILRLAKGIFNYIHKE